MRKIKDKHIKRTSLYSDSYLAIVIYYQDRPERDEHKPKHRTFFSLREAQKWLDKFPPDIWCGWDKDDLRYDEVDERNNEKRRKNQKKYPRNHKASYVSGWESTFGRSFARRI